ncbi:MAG TPA: hypothetical protein VHM70_25355 [Polyangiaceae bacterium]|nr:hypothetical protein [Polyangiaceae bacterium]
MRFWDWSSALTAVVAVVACGPDEPSDGSGSPKSSASETSSKGTQSARPESTLAVPENIDVVSCAMFTYETPADSKIADQCFACCQHAGFIEATFTNDGHCTCAKAASDNRDVICATPAASVSKDACLECCGDAGFHGFIRDGEASKPAACHCNTPEDTQVCGSQTAPDLACGLCCLQHGFSTVFRSSTAETTCGCAGP